MTVAGRAVRGVSVAGASGVAGWPGEAGTQFGLMDAPLVRVASAAPRVAAAAAAAAAADSAAGAGSTQTVPRPWACNATGDSPRPRSPARPGHRAPSQACSASTSATQAHNDRSNWRWRYAGSGMARCCHASAAARRRYPVRRHQVRRRRRNDSSPRPAASVQHPPGLRLGRARPPWWPPPCRHRTTSRRRWAQSMRCWPPSALPASTRAARTHHRTPPHPAAAPMSRCRRWWPRSSSRWPPGCPSRPRGLPARQ